ncbi:MAG TPA: biopolymer transporter ExbD [Bdellovibrionales bacterium]|nr:biopolymer transporter ExbD [Bdellovibrionales bacterium]
MAGGGGGEEPNLTPFIDLFSVLVCFLLMTAAWLQLETLQTNIEAATSKETPDDSPPPPPDPKKVNLAIGLGKDATTLSEGEKVSKIPKLDGKFNRVELERILKVWRDKYPDKKDVVVNSESGVRYGELIGAYDLLVATGWPDVGINPN